MGIPVHEGQWASRDLALYEILDRMYGWEKD